MVNTKWRLMFVELLPWILLGIILLILTGWQFPAWAVVDTTPPTIPTQVSEGSLATDTDYDSDGAYTVYWVKSTDSESGIVAY